MTTVLACIGLISIQQAAPSEPMRQISLEQDREAFSYFLVPTDVVGFQDSPEGAQLTHDGAIITGFGEFRILLDGQPMYERVKRLYKGFYPMPVLEHRYGDVSLNVQYFAAPRDLDPTENLLVYVRVEATNLGSTPQKLQIAGEFGEARGYARAPVGCVDWYREKLLGAEWAADGGPSFTGMQAIRAGHLVMSCDRPGSAAVVDGRHQIAFSPLLEPGQQWSATFRIPYVPVDGPDEIADVLEPDPSDVFEALVDHWDGVFERMTQLRLEEPKVMRALKASLAYDLIARDVDESGARFLQMVNEFQYDAFFPRDAAYIARSYMMLGLLPEARQTIEQYLVRNASGAVTGLLRTSHPDDWGQSVWVLGQYFRATGDMEFAREIWPALPGHLADMWLELTLHPTGLWPPAPPYDNEAIDGQYTGHNFWALVAFHEAMNIATALGHEMYAERWRRQYAQYEGILKRRLQRIGFETDGYIPPGLDDPLEGYDWANASAGVYPFGVYEPGDRMTRETIELIREYKYREGIMTYGPNAFAIQQAERQGRELAPGWLHHYLTFYVAQTMLALGMQREVVEDLYSILVHTSSTHAGFEYSIMPWANRDPGGNYPPHGWFAARYNELIRNMLVREQGDELHIASALSPEWVGADKSVGIERAPTWFGDVGYELSFGASGCELTFTADWRKVPRAVVFHVPWFVEASIATADGEEVAIENGAIRLDPGVRSLRVDWKRAPTPGYSYDETVESWLRLNHNPELRGRGAYLFPTPQRPQLATLTSMFIDEYELRFAKPENNTAEIRYTLDGSPVTASSSVYKVPIVVKEAAQLRAKTFWSNSRISSELRVQLRKAEPRPIDATMIAAGWGYELFRGEFDSLPDFDALTPSDEGSLETIDLAGLPGERDNFAVRFSGYIGVPETGVYTIILGSDDGSRLLIGDEVLIDNDGLHPYREVPGQIALSTGGYHRVTVEFFERTGAERLELWLIGPNGERRKL